ncbi:hypothetical protein WBG78_18850 [Chryseolinea sp. T2]|uniref:hypothetical protein n=1 Tax=Chryseolinea sp. T2 TaxID=3129255 RepID=UPI0030784ED5
MSEPSDFIKEKIAIITTSFDFLVADFGFVEPAVNYDRNWVEVIYKNYHGQRKVVLIHDLREKYFYFYVTNRVDADHSRMSRNVKTFLEVFQHADRSIKEDDLQPHSDEPSQPKLKVNARLLEQLGKDVLRGDWF